MIDSLSLVRIQDPDQISLDTINVQLRVANTDSAEDDYIQFLTDAAVGMIDGADGIGHCLGLQQWRMTVNNFGEPSHRAGFPYGYTYDMPARARFWEIREPQVINIPLRPLVSVDSVSYRDNTGNTVVMDASTYEVDLDQGTISPAFGTHFPHSFGAPGSVKVEFTAGYDDVTLIPANLRHAIQLTVSHWYENHEGVVGIGSRDTPQEVPLGVQAILRKYQTFNIR